MGVDQGYCDRSAITFGRRMQLAVGEDVRERLLAADVAEPLDALGVERHPVGAGAVCPHTARSRLSNVTIATASNAAVMPINTAACARFSPFVSGSAPM